MLDDRRPRGPRGPGGRRTGIAIAALVALAAVVAAVVLVSGGGSDPRPARPRAELPPPLSNVRGTDRDQTFVVRQPPPGYVAWTGAWQMPDGSLMVSYTRATGPVDPAQRSHAPPAVLDAFGVRALPPNRDFWGLDLSVHYTRSGDGGRTWEETRSDAFQAIAPHAYSGQATFALDDGTLVRRVNGDDLRDDPDIPHTAFLQYLTPGAERWSEPQVLLDPAEHTYQITRIRRLEDGRLIATGNAWDEPAVVKPEDRVTPSRFLLMVSSDEGQSWREALTIPPDTGPLPGNEWDTAELPSGDLLAVMRTAEAADPGTQVVKQGRLRASGDGWVLEDVRAAPFAVTGHPELLATEEGPILYVATSGIQFTQNAGRTWEPLLFGTERELLRSHYYPRSLQTADGVIHVFSHLGTDHPYSVQRQGILEDTFRIAGDP